MVQLLSILEELGRNISFKRLTNCKNDVEKEVLEEVRRKSPMPRSNSIAPNFSKKGMKGVNQDRLIVWQDFGCQDDMIFCGVFDGHGPWGHYLSKRVSKLLPSLLCHWHETLAPRSFMLDCDGLGGDSLQLDVWKQSYLKSCDIVDKELEQDSGVDSFYSGTTALSIVKQGDLIVIANVGDSRAVLATTTPDNNLMAIQLTTDFKPSLPDEAERITQSKGEVFCLDDEPGVYRVWQPNKSSPGLAISRAFGDNCMKNFGLISVPEVTHRYISTNDQFVILATDGVWDVVSNQLAVEIVSSATEREKSAKYLVEYAASVWKCKRPGIAMDDISAICFYFHPSPFPLTPLE